MSSAISRLQIFDNRIDWVVVNYKAEQRLKLSVVRLSVFRYYRITIMNMAQVMSGKPGVAEKAMNMRRMISPQRRLLRES